MATLPEPFPDVIELNVGGKSMTTLFSTLTKDPDSMLAAMFSGRHVVNKDKDGRYFIDCDGHLFEYILNYLRFGVLPPKENALEMYNLAVYFSIHSLFTSLESYSAVQHWKRIEEIKSNIDIEEYERIKQEAIIQLYTCNARPQDTKVLHIRPKNQCSEKCYDYKYKNKLEKGEIHICLSTNNDVIELNVGGKLMTTLLSTLTKDPNSMLAAMFNGRHVINKDKDGRYLIDCDGHLFGYILNYLRFGVFPPKENALEMYNMAVYFSIQSLVTSLESYSAVQHLKRIEEIKNNIDIEEYERIKQEAIKKLYTCNARPEDTKVLHIRPKRSCPRKCYDYKYKDKLEKGEMHNCLSIKANIRELQDIVICLAHDMYHLGFGKYTYFAGPEHFKCLYHSDTMEYKILIVEHEIIQ